MVLGIGRVFVLVFGTRFDVGVVDPVLEGLGRVRLEEGLELRGG